MTSLSEFYAENRHKFSGSPEWSCDATFQKYATRVGRNAGLMSWQALQAAVDLEDSRSAAMNDPRLPLYTDDTAGGWTGIQCPEDSRDKLTALCAAVTIPTGPAPDILPTMEALLALSMHWYQTPREITEKNDDFTFYRVQCLLGGAGPTSSMDLGDRLSDVFPMFRQEWGIGDAHKVCGWPTALIWLDWKDLPDWTLDTKAGESVPDWLRVIAYLHVLKHVRRDDAAIVVTYAGKQDVIPVARGSMMLGQWRESLGPLYGVLRVPSGKEDSAKNAAMSSALGNIGLQHLLAREALTTLPGHLLVGPWSKLTPAPRGASFFRTDMRLDGVWIARDGHINPYEGSNAEVLRYAWPVAKGNLACNVQAKADYAGFLPRTYALTLPSAVLAEAFPHWVRPGDVEGMAYESMLDACLCASIIRSGEPTIKKEYPLIAILPLDPSHAESTNQGKGLLTMAIATAMVPGIELTSAMDSASAPDVRAISAIIRKFGTIALDEFQIPSSRAHVLARDQLQTLCLGGKPASGRVYSNGDETDAALQLSHSIVLNAKWLDLADDLVNRTLPLFLDVLPDEQRARTDVKSGIESGLVGLQVRLAAVALVEALRAAGWFSVLGRGLPAAPHSWRYVTHRQLAVMILHGRTDLPVAECAHMVDTVSEQMKDELTRHMQMADNSGISSTTSSGHNLRITWPAFWDGIDSTTMTNLVASAGMEYECKVDGEPAININRLLRLRLEAVGMQGHRFAPIISQTMGFDLKATNAAISKSFTVNLRVFFREQLAKPAGTHEWVPMPGDLAGGWEVACFQRMKATNPSSVLAVAFRKRA